MSDHLPECPWADRGYAFPCICDRLRACEQRCDAKRHAEVKAWADLSRDIFDAGYAAGLSAARDAVAAEAQARHVDGPTMFITLSQALAAIDGLKEDK